MKKIVGANIKFHRERAHLSQERAAILAGITASHWGNIERGANNTTIELMDRIARALTVEMSDLFVGVSPGDVDFEELRHYEMYYLRLEPAKRKTLRKIIYSMKELLEIEIK